MGVPVGRTVGVADGPGVEVAVGTGVGVAVPTGVEVAVGVRVGVGVGVGGGRAEPTDTVTVPRFESVIPSEAAYVKGSVPENPTIG